MPEVGPELSGQLGQQIHTESQQARVQGFAGNVYHISQVTEGKARERSGAIALGAARAMYMLDSRDQLTAEVIWRRNYPTETENYDRFREIAGGIVQLADLLYVHRLIRGSPEARAEAQRILEDGLINETALIEELVSADYINSADLEHEIWDNLDLREEANVVRNAMREEELRRQNIIVDWSEIKQFTTLQTSRLERFTQAVQETRDDQDQIRPDRLRDAAVAVMYISPPAWRQLFINGIQENENKELASAVMDLAQAATMYHQAGGDESVLPNELDPLINRMAQEGRIQSGDIDPASWGQMEGLQDEWPTVEEDMEKIKQRLAEAEAALPPAEEEAEAPPSPPAPDEEHGEPPPVEPEAEDIEPPEGPPPPEIEPPGPPRDGESLLAYYLRLRETAFHIEQFESSDNPEERQAFEQYRQFREAARHDIGLLTDQEAKQIFFVTMLYERFPAVVEPDSDIGGLKKEVEINFVDRVRAALKAERVEGGEAERVAQLVETDRYVAFGLMVREQTEELRALGRSTVISAGPDRFFLDGDQSSSDDLLLIDLRRGGNPKASQRAHDNLRFAEILKGADGILTIESCGIDLVNQDGGIELRDWLRGGLDELDGKNTLRDELVTQVESSYGLEGEQRAEKWGTRMWEEQATQAVEMLLGLHMTVVDTTPMDDDEWRYTLENKEAGWSWVGLASRLTPSGLASTYEHRKRCLVDIKAYLTSGREDAAFKETVAQERLPVGNIEVEDLRRLTRIHGETITRLYREGRVGNHRNEIVQLYEELDHRARLLPELDPTTALSEREALHELETRLAGEGGAEAFLLVTLEDQYRGRYTEAGPMFALARALHYRAALLNDCEAIVAASNSGDPMLQDAADVVLETGDQYFHSLLVDPDVLSLLLAGNLQHLVYLEGDTEQHFLQADDIISRDNREVTIKAEAVTRIQATVNRLAGQEGYEGIEAIGRIFSDLQIRSTQEEVVIDLAQIGEARIHKAFNPAYLDFAKVAWEKGLRDMTSKAAGRLFVKCMARYLEFRDYLRDTVNGAAPWTIGKPEDPRGFKDLKLWGKDYGGFGKDALRMRLALGGLARPDVMKRMEWDRPVHLTDPHEMANRIHREVEGDGEYYLAFMHELHALYYAPFVNLREVQDLNQLMETISTPTSIARLALHTVDEDTMKYFLWEMVERHNRTVPEEQRISIREAQSDQDLDRLYIKLAAYAGLNFDQSGGRRRLVVPEQAVGFTPLLSRTGREALLTARDGTSLPLTHDAVNACRFFDKILGGWSGYYGAYDKPNKLVVIAHAIPLEIYATRLDLDARADLANIPREWVSQNIPKAIRHARGIGLVGGFGYLFDQALPGIRAQLGSLYAEQGESLHINDNLLKYYLGTGMNLTGREPKESELGITGMPILPVTMLSKVCGWGKTLALRYILMRYTWGYADILEDRENVVPMPWLQIPNIQDWSEGMNPGDPGILGLILGKKGLKLPTSEVMELLAFQLMNVKAIEGNIKKGIFRAAFWEKFWNTVLGIKDYVRGGETPWQRFIVGAVAPILSGGLFEGAKNFILANFNLPNLATGAWTYMWFEAGFKVAEWFGGGLEGGLAGIALGLGTAAVFTLATSQRNVSLWERLVARVFKKHDFRGEVGETAEAIVKELMSRAA